MQRALLAIFAIFLVAGCAVNTKLNPQRDAAIYQSAGRISLVVQSEQAQSFAGSFELQGDPSAGTLGLYSPLGSTVAVLRWSPGVAQLDSAGSTQNYASVDDMMQRTTGAAVPIEALFAWLRGDNPAVPGWQADVSRHAQGRISAQRSSPLPTAQLRIVLDTPAP